MYNSFAKINKYFNNNKAYFASLEIILIICLIYFLDIISLLNIDFIQQHISNFTGSALLMLIIIGPKHFKKSILNKRVILAAIFVIVLNILLEFSAPIDTLNFKYLYWENFNTPDPLDALGGVLGVVTIIIVSVLNTTHNKKTTK